MNKQDTDVCQLQVGEVLRTGALVDRTTSCPGSSAAATCELGGDSGTNLWTSDGSIFQYFHVGRFVRKHWVWKLKWKMENPCFVCQISFNSSVDFRSLSLHRNLWKCLLAVLLLSKSYADSGWPCFSFFLLLGHSSSLLGLQAGGAAQLLQTGRFTGKVTQAESPSFPPRALLEVSWVCQMSSGHKTAISQPLLEDKLANNNKIGHQSSSLIAHETKRPAQWWKPSLCFYGMLACVYRLNLHLEAFGTLFFSLLFFNFPIQYRFLLCFALITPQSLTSFFDVILPITHWSSLCPNRNVDFVVSFFFFHVLYFFSEWMQLSHIKHCTFSLSCHFLCLSNAWTILLALIHDRSCPSVRFVSEKLC